MELESLKYKDIFVYISHTHMEVRQNKTEEGQNINTIFAVSILTQD